MVVVRAGDGRRFHMRTFLIYHTNAISSFTTFRIPKVEVFAKCRIELINVRNVLNFLMYLRDFKK